MTREDAMYGIGREVRLKHRGSILVLTLGTIVHANSYSTTVKWVGQSAPQEVTDIEALEFVS